MISGRALHYVLKIGDRGANEHFFRGILGMKVLRHEEFTQGCEAQCNGPYDNRWSKTMIGYGPESSHFVMELTYNYGVKSYELGNDFYGITIQSKDIIGRAKKENYPISVNNGIYALKSPDGYTFFVKDEPHTGIDPVQKVTLNCTNIEKTVHYWHDLLKMNVVSKGDQEVLLAYSSTGAQLEFKKLDGTFDRKKAYGRIAFAVPFDIQPKIDEIIKSNSQSILTPLISLSTPDKADVRVIILADPDGHEICFVDDEGFSQLSQVDPNGDSDLDKYIKADPFQTNK